jgi:hypothetical protein
LIIGRTRISQLWSFQGARELQPAQRETTGLRRSLKTQQQTSSHAEVDVDLGGPGFRTEASFHTTVWQRLRSNSS